MTYDTEQQAFLDRVGEPIPNISTGRDLVEEIRQESSNTLNAMRRLGEQRMPNKAKYQALQDYSYDLKKARINVQNQMTRLFKASRRSA